MLELVNIIKAIGKFSLENINLKINNGDYFTLLGESGAGKTMLLEIISGIVKLDSGKVILNGTEITNIPIQNRNFGIVYQNQALFPHMSVFENIAFPLKCKKNTKLLIENTVKTIAEETEILHLLNRNVTDLSGGEAQRVAIARALATNPEILLLDEPLSFLDVNLKHGITCLLRKINKKGLTIIHVTHNYKEAVSLSNRIAVLGNGKVIQEGNINDVLQNPKSKFVAGFLGIKNYYSGKVIINNNMKYFEINNCRFKVSEKFPLGELNVWIRNNNVYLINDINRNNFDNKFKCRIIDIEPTTRGVEIYTDIGIPIYLYINNDQNKQLKIKQNSEIEVGVKSEDICF